MKKTIRQLFSLLIVASMLLSMVTVAVAVTEPTFSISEATVDADEGIKKLVFQIATPAGTEGITSGGVIFSYDSTKVMPVIKDDYSDNPLDGSAEDADYMVDSFIPLSGRINGTRYNYQLVDPETMKVGDRIAAKVDIYTTSNLYDAKDGMNILEFYFRYLVDENQLNNETFQLETSYTEGSPLKTWYSNPSEAAAIKIKDKANNEYSYGKYEGANTIKSFSFTYTGWKVVPTYPLKAITLTPAVTSVESPALGEAAATVAIEAKATNTKDQEITLPADAAWSLEAPVGVTLSNGVLTVAPNAQAGTAKVKLTSGNITGSTEIAITRATPVAKTLILTANGSNVENYAVIKPVLPSDAAKTVAFAVAAKDQYGASINTDATITATALAGTSFADNTLTVNYGAENGTITVTATSGALTDSINVTVSELVVDWSGVSTSAITYGQSIANAVTFPASGTATANGNTYNGTFFVENANETPNAGSATATVAFKITSDGEFKNLVITKDYAVTVNKANYNMNSYTVADKTVTYNGQSHTITGTGTLPSNVEVASVTYNGSTEAPVNAGTYNVVVSFTGDSANYNAIPDKTATLTINQADAVITAEARQPFTYDGTAKSASATLNHNETTLSYSENSFTNVGEYDVTITAAETTNYKSATKQVKVVINKAAATGFETAAPTVTYTAKEAFDTNITSTVALKEAMNLPATATAAYAGGTEEVAITWADATQEWNDKLGTYTFVGTASSDNLTFASGVNLVATATITPVNATVTSALGSITVAKAVLDSASDYSDIRLPQTITLDADGETITITPVWSMTLDELKNIPAGGSVTLEVTNLPVWATVPAARITFSVTDKYPVDITVTLPSDTYVYGTPIGVPTAVQSAVDNGTDDTANITFKYVGETVAGTVYESECAPTDAGSYRVVATLVSPTHAGTASYEFEITKLDVAYQVNNATKKYKDTNPDFTGSVTSGTLPYDETEADLGVNFTCADTTDYAVGQYDNIISAEISNLNYNATVTPGTLTIIKKPLVEVGIPVISGTSAVGETLTATLEGVDTNEYDYQWYVDGSAVDGATNSTYVPVIADSNKEITVVITAKDDGNYEGFVTSEATTVAKYEITGALTASVTDGAFGVPSVIDAGDTVTIDVSSIDNYAELVAAGIDFEYQWFVNDTALAGETTSSITLAQGITGTLSVKVTATGNFTGTIEHLIGEINKLTLTGELTLQLADGIITYTSTLPGTLDSDYTLTWYRNSEAMGSDLTYTVTPADYGKTITLKATAIGDIYTGEVISNAVAIPALVPSNVQITTTVGTTTVTAAFTADANGADITEFNATITDGTTPVSVVVTPVDGQFTHRFTGLKSGKTYTIAATATNAAGTSAEATTTVTPKASESGGSLLITYTVKFDTNGGNEIAPQKVSSQGTVKEPATPVKEGYIFEGWYKDKALTKAYKFSSQVTSNFTLYAKWTKVEEPEDPEKPEDPENPDTPDVPDEPVWTNSFKDVNENDWFYDSVKYVVTNKLMNGTSEEEFAPNATLTRAMLVTVLYRNEGEPATNRSIPFADVDMGEYYANAVSWAKQNGIVNGITENEFAPNAEITREQIAAIMFRYAQYKGMDAITMEENLHFDDSNEISEYAISALNWAVGKGLMKGKSETTINSQDNATRAEIATILQRFIENLK